MKHILLFTVILSVFFSRCGDNEDELTPSNVDRNWFVIEDNPNDEIDHLRYLIYDEYQMSVYYNDTLGKEEILSQFGERRIRYEILKTFYIPASSMDKGNGGGYFSLCPPERKTELRAALDMLKTTVIPRISERMYISSILLVDTLLVTSTGIGKGDPATNCKGYNTWLIGNALDIVNMTEEERHDYGINLLINLVQSSNRNLFTEFQKISSDLFGAKYSASSTSMCFYPIGSYSEGDFYYGFPGIINVAEVYSGIRLEKDAGYPAEKLTDLNYLNFPSDLCPETVGIIKPAEIPEGMPRPEWIPDLEGNPAYLALIPTAGDDYNSFCQALFEYTPAEFREKYANFPVVLEKYEFLKKAFEEFGFTFE